MKRFVSSTIVLLISGCMSHQAPEPITFSKISAVQADIKRQVGVYLRAVAKLPSTLSANKNDYACGDGKIDFDITSVKADLTTSLDDTVSGYLGVTLPVGAIGSVGPSAGLSSEIKNSQELVYNQWSLASQKAFVDAYPAPTAADMNSSPLAEAILALRAALIQAALKVDPVSRVVRGPQPCFSDFDPAKPGDPAAHSFTIGITTTKDGNVGLEVKLAVIDAKLNGDSKAASGNTITVTFAETYGRYRAELLAKCTKNPDYLPICNPILAGDWSSVGSGGVGFEGGIK